MKRLPVILLSIIVLALALVVSCKEPGPENNLNTQVNWILDADGIAPADKSLVKGNVVIPSEVDGVKVTKIKFGAFRDCTELTGITIPDTVTYIGMGSFSGCTSLESLTIPSSVTTIKYAAFQGCGITSLVIPDTVKILEAYCFKSLKKLTSLTLANIDEIDSGVFEDCDSLTTVTIPAGMTSISEYMFFGCDILETVNLPDSVTDIGWSAFEDCPKLTSIAFPAALNRLGPYAFRKCTGLKTIKYDGTMAQWAKVSTNFMWHDEVPATVVKGSDGDADFH